MNKIKVVANGEYQINVNQNIIVNDYTKSSEVNKEWLFIYVPSNMDETLDLKLCNTNTKEKIYILLDDNSKLDLFMIANKQLPSNYEFKFIIKDNSELVVNKFYYGNGHHEKLIIDLIGYKSKVYYNLSTVTKDKQKYIMNINHSNQETVSIINNRGITINNTALELEINGYILKGMKKSVMEQTSKIITLGENYSVIKPNLFIDENDVSVRHGASIGSFQKESIFYLQTRGLSKANCYQLLMQAFILSILKITEEKKKELLQIVNIGGENHECSK
ncbi:MAG: SufD family Fe-S cluster assembly protein [Bacilli bacterium]|nr:SufD family Fe-S cluster assembly protein [Bacilli bacterium]